MSIPASESWELWHSVVLAFRDWKQRRAAMKEIDALASSESERLLGECGLTRDDLSVAMRHTGGANPLPHAMRSIGVDPRLFEARHRAWNRDMTRTCMMCSERGHCRDQIAAGSFATHYRQFCPNRDSLAEMADLDLAHS